MLTRPARFPLAVLPTPLVHAPRLSAALDREVWIKRDDLTGFALGGNKVRTLEVLVAEALDQRCDHLVGCGGPGSNLCSALAAAAATAGLGCTLVLHGKEPAAAHPNLAMMRAFGARICFTGDPDRASTPGHAAVAADRLRSRGRRPYVVPRGAASGPGATAYALAAEELASQLTFRPAHVVAPVGSGGTLAGLLAGWATFGVPGTLVGVAVSRPLAETRREVIRLSADAARCARRRSSRHRSAPPGRQPGRRLRPRRPDDVRGSPPRRSHRGHHGGHDVCCPRRGRPRVARGPDRALAHGWLAGLCG